MCLQFFYFNEFRWNDLICPPSSWWNIQRKIVRLNELTNINSYSILKPLSVIIAEYIGSFPKYWLFSASFLSDIATLYVFETKFINEFGVTLLNTFRLLWCLYSDHRLPRFCSDHQYFLVSQWMSHCLNEYLSWINNRLNVLSNIFKCLRFCIH